MGKSEYFFGLQCFLHTEQNIVYVALGRIDAVLAARKMVEKLAGHVVDLSSFYSN